MILKLYMEEQMVRQNKWWFSLDGTQEVVARAVHGANMRTCLWYGDHKFQFEALPKMIKKRELSFKYPYYYNMKKMLGFRILENKNVIAELHVDDLRCSEKGKDQHIGTYVFYYEGETYLQFHIGLPKHGSTYFCLFKENGELVSIIARHSEGKEYHNCKATLYIEKDEYLLITLLSCTSKMIDIQNYWDDHHDPTAGLFTSKLEAERAMYDAGFIERVKTEGNQKAAYETLKIKEEDIKLATEMRDDQKELTLKEKVLSRIEHILLFLLVTIIVVIVLKIFGWKGFVFI